MCGSCYRAFKSHIYRFMENNGNFWVLKKVPVDSLYLFKREGIGSGCDQMFPFSKICEHITINLEDTGYLVIASHGFYTGWLVRIICFSPRKTRNTDKGNEWPPRCPTLILRKLIILCHTHCFLLYGGPKVKLMHPQKRGPDWQKLAATAFPEGPLWALVIVVKVDTEDSHGTMNKLDF